MTDPGERVLKDLQRIKTEIEELVRATLDSVGEHAGDALKHLQASIGQVCEQASAFKHELHGELRQRTRQTDRYVRDNAWIIIGVTAATAFLLGVIAGRRDRIH